MRQDAALSATLCHPDVVSTSDRCHSGDPINTICSRTLASSDDGAVFVWQATCFLPCAMRNHMSQADTDAHRGQHLDMPDRGTAALELQAVLSLRLPSFYRDALRLLGNAADAEDAVQEALLAAYKHIGQFRGQSQMSTWVTTIVRNCARMQLRKRPRLIHMRWMNRSERSAHTSYLKDLRTRDQALKMRVETPSLLPTCEIVPHCSRPDCEEHFSYG
jgi:hypothetical protein